MPFAFLIVGLYLIVAGLRNQSSQLLALLKGDLTGTNNYVYWILSIIIIGALGYIEPLKPLSRAFLVLVLVVLILKTGNKNNSGGGFFAEFTQALKTSTATGAANPVSSTQQASPLTFV